MNKRFFNRQNLTRRLRLLPVLFAMLLMPLSGWAQGTAFGGDGSSTNPYVISTANELKDFADQYNAGALTFNCSVELSTNIDCTDLTSFTPIGNSDHPFTGTFDGKHHAISNLTCSAGGYFGLFGEVGTNGTTSAAGNISYLTLDNCTFSGGNVGGAIAGYLRNGTISNCTVSGCTITASSTSENAAQAGAIIGHCNNNNMTLTNNFYYYTVKTITINNNVTDERTGYQQRGVADFVYDPDTDTNVYTDITENNGAVMYTKTLALPAESPSGTVMGDEGGFYAYAESNPFDILGAPGQPVKVKVIPGVGSNITAISVTYGTDQTAAIELTKTEEGTYYYTIGEMPDADATLNVTFTPTYDLRIGETRVTPANAHDVFDDGKVSYAKGVLTLNGATLASGITSSLDKLKIVLAGENTITGTIAGTGTLYFATDDKDAKLTFTTTEAAAISGFTEVKYLNGLRMKSVTGGFDVSVPSAYNLTVNGTPVTSDNRKDVLGDGTSSHEPSVVYDGEYTLILTNAALTQKIELGSENTLDHLYIHLEGRKNTITSADNVIVATAKPNMELHFITNRNFPGKLVYTSTNVSNPTLEGAFTGFKKVSFDNELGAVLIGKTITIAEKIEPMINEDKGTSANVDFTNSSSEMYITPSTNLSNTIVSDILFTLADDGTADSPDGYDGSCVVINSEVSDANLEAAMNLEPGSDAFNEKFTGLIFKLPASTGTIFIEAWSHDGHQLCVKIGDQTPTYIKLTVTPTTYDIDYTCGSDTYVYIYLPQASPSTAPRRGRIAPNSDVSCGLHSISVTSSSMISSASSKPASNYMLLDKVAADAVIASAVPGEGLTFNDASITNLEDDMFLTGGGAPTLKISSDLPFIDMSGTSIKNMEISRSAGPFNGVPENVFIYMPAGNTTSEKNVVIGDVCDRMELKAELPGSGVNAAKPFKVSKNFTAAQATLMRTFAAGGDDSKATIYLPYAIPQKTADEFGQFFKYDGISGNDVQMTKVTSGGLKANMPYIFQAKAGGVVNPEVKIVTVQGLPAETEGFKGVYEQTSCGGDNWYGYAAEAVDGAKVGQFVKLGSGASIAPFRAYMVANGNKPSYAIRWGGIDETTAIEEPEIQTVNERKPVEGWYTLTGARLVGLPTTPGLYIYNGRTVVVK